MIQLDIERSHRDGSVVAIVPTMGRSDILEQCLLRLKSQQGGAPEVVVVSQGSDLPLASADLADRVIHLSSNVGYAAACNLAIDQTDSDFIAVINDDALVELDWLVSLCRQLEKNPAAASAQGVNLSLDQPDTIDSCGIAWNTFWRPVQIGSGQPQEAAGANVRPIFGVSGTAALYRREALQRATPIEGHYFDPYLVSFYEDVELSIRLYLQGLSALLVPEARALHQGGTTSRTMAGECERLRYRNRYLVLARLSGASFRSRAVLLFARDVLSIAAMVVTARISRTRGACRGLIETPGALENYRHKNPKIKARKQIPVRIRRANSWPEEWPN